jgi:hypothetical protein
MARRANAGKRWRGKLGQRTARYGATALVAAAGTAVWALPAHASGPTMITSCTESAVSAAIAHGGLVEFAQNCDVELTSTLTLKNLDVDLEGNGYNVDLDG